MKHAHNMVSKTVFGAGLLLCSFFLTGCTSKIVKSRAEADRFIKENPGYNPYDIRIDHPDGTDSFYGEDLDKEKAAKKNEPVKDGTVMMYEEPAEAAPGEVFKVANDSAMQGGGTPTEFTLTKRTKITELTTYHWNGGKGANAGTISIKSTSGKIFGPWPVELVNGVYWKTVPDVTLEPGSYSVIDSEPKTWSQNAGTGGQGSAWASGIVVDGPKK